MINIDSDQSNSSSEYQNNSQSQSNAEASQSNFANLAPNSEEQSNKRESNISHSNSNQRHKKIDNILHGKQKQQEKDKMSSQKNIKITKQIVIHKDNKPRLIIEKIVLQNFKSYANTQTIGPFHQNFTSIIGPNGSGKSNLIESMLFIFGFNARWMRSNRLNQLIHNSATMKNISKASVAVYFKKILDLQNGTIEDVPNTSFYIKRTINTSNTSKYYINNNESTNQQVKSKLKNQGIDLQNNRFLILQGQVQQISQMKPKSGDADKPGLLQYLQDIIGSNIYIEKITQLVKKYQQKDQLRLSKASLVKNDQQDLKAIAKPKQQAVKFVKTQRTIYQIRNIIHQCLIKDADLKAQQNRDKVKKYQENLVQIKNQERQKMAKNSQRIKQLRKIKEQINKYQLKLKNTEEDFEKFKATDNNLNEQIAFKSSDLVKMAKQNQELQAFHQKIIQQSRQIQQNLPKNEKKLQQMGEQLEKKKVQLNKYSNPQLNQKIKLIQNQSKRFQIQIQTMKEKSSAISKKLEKIKSQGADFSSKMNENQIKIDQTKKIIGQIKQALSIAGQSRSSIINQIEGLKRKRFQVKQAWGRANAQIGQIQNQKKQTNIMNNMFTKIMQRKIDGVLGRLGDLAKTTPQYDEIITTCNGPRLDNILCRTYQAAQQVINFLKSQKIGRASCIILDKIQEAAVNMKRPFQNLQNAVRLFDVVDYSSEEVKTAFYFVLQDTLYCQNSNLGLKYSMGNDNFRRRVVSKKQTGGYIVYQPNGLMMSMFSRRGGFENKGTRKTNRPEKQSTDQIKRCVNQKSKIQIAIKEVQNAIEIKQNQLRVVDSDILKFQREKQEWGKRMLQFDDQLNEAKRNISKQQQNSKRNSLNQQNYTRELASIESRIKQIQKQKQSSQKKLNDLIEQRKKIEGSQVTKLRQEYKQIRNKYTQFEKEFNKNTSILAQTKNRLTTNQSDRKKIFNRIQTLRKNIEKLKQEREQGQQNAINALNHKNQIQKKYKQYKQTEKKLISTAEQDQNLIRQSKKRVQTAKRDLDIARQQAMKYDYQVQQKRNDLSKLRQDYKHLLKNYDFLQHLEEIQRMQLLKQPGMSGSIIQSYQPLDSSVLNTSVLNTSQLDTSYLLNTSIQSLGKSFPVQKLLSTMPNQDIGNQIEQFLVYREKLKTILQRETQALEKFTDVNVSVIKEFKQKFLSYKEKYEQYEELKKQMMGLKINIDQLKHKRLSEFRDGFSIINSKLKEVYQLLTRGGDADLELIDSLDPFSDGINFSVRPPKKSWKQINKLSGGQKTLSSLSLIFALHFFKPTPLYFMDQIDAALDYKNVSIVAEYIKKRTKNAQFIIISLRNNMFDLANKLVGVYKSNDKTQTLLFRPDKYLQLKKIKQQKQKQKQNDDGNMVNINTNMNLNLQNSANR